MNKFIINTHSFVDLITNSSSELFICDTDKTVDITKDIIISLCEIHNKKVDIGAENGKIDITKIFWDKPNLKYSDPGYGDKYNYKFKPIDICKYTFKSCNERYDYLNLDDVYSDPDPDYDYGASALVVWEIKNKAPESGPGSTEYNNYIKKKTEYIESVFSRYHQKLRESFHKLLEVYCIDNNVNYEHICKNIREDIQGRYICFHLECNEEYGEFFNDLKDSLSWRYTTTKGNIRLQSACDNTIPFWMVESIQTIFNAGRVHLG